MPLAEAVQRHVQPGMFLHFGSTPSRSNAAIVELVRQFRGRDPQFTLSATGFHSAAHLLALYRLGRRLISCFYGDNYPQPRPNALYQTLLDEGCELEQWSLLNYVLALRAGALGHAGALTRSLASTSLAAELTRHGRYRELPADTLGNTQNAPASGLVLPLCADISFLHAAAADEQGQAWFCPPHSEGFYGALGARAGMILTVDRFLPTQQLQAHPEWIALPAHRVLAVCEAPFGAHPQPVHCLDADDAFSYRDDFAAYLWWRQVTQRPELLADFEREVLQARDSWQAYRQYLSSERLERLRCSARAPQAQTSRVQLAKLAKPDLAAVTESGAPSTQLFEAERCVVFAARYLARRIAEQGLTCVLAGIGQAFSAARLCKTLLGDAAQDVELMVETGFTGFGEPGALGDSYLLSQRNIALSTRLGNVENVLGALVCGAHNRCIGVIGGAQVDGAGNVNSTRVNGQLLVGSGGACDIALGAREVVVLARTERLVPAVEYITSAGVRVCAVVTEHGILERAEGGWVYTQGGLTDALEPSPLASTPWPGVLPAPRPTSQPLSAVEYAFIQALRSEANATASQQGDKPALGFDTHQARTRGVPCHPSF